MRDPQGSLPPLPIALFLLFSIGVFDVDASAQSWPRFLNSTYDGAATEFEGSIDWTSSPRFLWALDVGEGYGIGSLSSSHYYHFDATGSSRSGTLQQRVRKIDLVTGDEVWSASSTLDYADMYGYESGPRSSPVLTADRVITLGVDGVLSCRDREDGSEQWEVDTNKKYGVVQNFFGVGSSPLVLGKQVLVMVGGSPPEDAEVPPGQLDRVSPNGSLLVSFDLDNGKENWRCGDDLASYSSPRPIELDGDTYVLLLARDHLWLVDSNQGTVNWKFPFRASVLESVNAMTPVVQGDLVLVSDCYQNGSVLLKVSADAAVPQWRDPERVLRNQSLRCHWATPILYKGRLYGGSGRNNGDSSFRCVDFLTGELKWSDDRRRRCSVTRVGEMLLVLDETARLQAVQPDAERLQVIGQWDLSQPDARRPSLRVPCWSAPVVAGNRLLIRGDQKVIALELTSNAG
ncbi:MAG: PQQ-binding-like beta-propeller repeat protein [Planctomycetota bacterium]